MVSRKFLMTTNLVALLLMGCSAKYQCETTKVGVCASVEDTYEALYSSEAPQTREAVGSDAKDKPETKEPAITLKPQPVMPLREPERVYRIWVRDYEDENGYYISNHFIYVSVGGKWVMKPVKRTLGDVEDYDEKIKNYLLRKGKIKPPEEEEDEDDVDI